MPEKQTKCMTSKKNMLRYCENDRYPIAYSTL